MAADLRDQLALTCRALAQRGWGTSTSGNGSVRIGQNVYLTATGMPLAEVTRRNLAHMRLDGKLLGSIRPTKEAFVHLAIYANCPDAAALLHVHPAHAVAASALLGRRFARYIPPMTPQFVMRAGRVSLVPYFPPGDLALAEAIRNCPAKRAILLQNHGALAFAASPQQALGILEELEENCKVWLLSGGRGALTARQERLLLGRSM